jgi:hypothetical protein
VKYHTQCLTAELIRLQQHTDTQRKNRRLVIDRLRHLLATRAVKYGAEVPDDLLKPGWPYILTTTQLIEAGKALKQAIDDHPPF